MNSEIEVLTIHLSTWATYVKTLRCQAINPDSEYGILYIGTGVMQRQTRAKPECVLPITPVPIQYPVPSWRDSLLLYIDTKKDSL